MKDLWQAEKEKTLEIAFARAEAKYEAVPESLQESLKINKGLQEEIRFLSKNIILQNSGWNKYRDYCIGFFIGVFASVIASLIWLYLQSLFPMLNK